MAYESIETNIFFLPYFIPIQSFLTCADYSKFSTCLTHYVLFHPIDLLQIFLIKFLLKSTSYFLGSFIVVFMPCIIVPSHQKKLSQFVLFFFILRPSIASSIQQSCYGNPIFYVYQWWEAILVLLTYFGVKCFSTYTYIERAICCNYQSKFKHFPSKSFKINYLFNNMR